MHPDWGILPSEKYNIQIGIQGPDQLTPANKDTAYVYSQIGHVMGTIPTKQLSLLHHTYTTT